MEKAYPKGASRTAVGGVAPQLEKLLCALVYLGCLFPVFYTVAVLGGMPEASAGFLCSALVCLPGGFLARWSLQRLFYSRLGPANPLRKVGWAAEILLGVGAALTVFLFYPLPAASWKVNLYGGGCLMASNVLMYYLGRLLADRPAHGLLRRYGLSLISLSFLGALAVRFIAGELGRAYSVAPLLWALLFVLLGFLVVENQSAMDEMVARRNLFRRWRMGRARGFNLTVLQFLVAAVLAAFLFCRPLGRWLTGALEWLRQLLFPPEQDIVLPEVELEEPEFDLLLEPWKPVGSEEAFDKTLFPFLALGIGCILLVIFHRQIAWLFRELLRLLKDRVRSSGAAGEEGKEPSAYFVDCVEKLDAKEKRKRRFSNRQKLYNQQLEKLQQLCDPEKKVRYGYGLMRQAAMELGGEEWRPGPGDSPREITGRLRAAGRPADLELSGGIYEAVRYGGRPAGEQEADRVVQEAAGFLQTVQRPFRKEGREKRREQKRGKSRPPV